MVDWCSIPLENPKSRIGHSTVTDHHNKLWIIGGYGKNKLNSKSSRYLNNTLFIELHLNQKDDIGIVSWGLMETTMEQVFLKLAAVAHDFTSSKSENISAADKNKTMAERVEDLERKVHSSTLASNLVTVEDDVKDA